MTCCPACGGKLPDAPSVLVDQDRSSIIIDDREIHVTPSEGWVMEALIESYPKMVTRRQIMEWLYAPDNEPDDMKILDVYVC